MTDDRDRVWVGSDSFCRIPPPSSARTAVLCSVVSGPHISLQGTSTHSIPPQLVSQVEEMNLEHHARSEIIQ